MGMNETSATSASGLSLLPDGIATLTAIHFTIIAVVAILVVIGLIWGIRAKRSRTKATHDVIANAKEAGVPPTPIDAEPETRTASQSQVQAQKVASITPPQVQPPVQPQPERTPAVRTAPAPIADTPAPDVAPTPDRMADEPIAAAAPLDASPATEMAPPSTPEPAPIAPAPAAPIESTQPTPSYADDPVTQLKGLGPKVAAQLGALGVATIGQMAALSESEAQRIDAQLGNFTGRMGRDRWIEQARLLAAGDKAGFEAVFGKL